LRIFWEGYCLHPCKIFSFLSWLNQLLHWQVRRPPVRRALHTLMLFEKTSSHKITSHWRLSSTDKFTLQYISLERILQFYRCVTGPLHFNRRTFISSSLFSSLLFAVFVDYCKFCSAEERQINMVAFAPAPFNQWADIQFDCDQHIYFFVLTLLKRKRCQRRWITASYPRLIRVVLRTALRCKMFFLSALIAETLLLETCCKSDLMKVLSNQDMASAQLERSRIYS